MNQNDVERHDTDVALARYAVIAPLVSRKMDNAEYRAEVRRIVTITHRFPDGKEKRISERHLRRWCQWYREGRSVGDLEIPPGVDALKPIARKDRGTPRVLDPKLIERAIRLRAEEPSRQTADLICLLRSEAEARGETPPEVEEATLAYHLRARGATRKAFKQEGRAYPRYEHPYRNAVWQGDWSQGIPLPNPVMPGKTRLCHLHAFIDDHSRYITHAEFYFRQNLPCLEDCFRKAVLKGGVPERAYVDQGAVYHSRQIQLLAARLGINIIFATPYAPEGKGKIERFFRTVKDSFYPEARRANIQTLEELNTFFWAWLEEVYHARVHSETKQTPKERWEAGASGVRMPDPASLGDLFLWEETRQVDKAGCIHMAGNAYPVGEHLVGRQVTVRFDPFDLSKVRIYFNGSFVEAASPQELVSHTYRKALPRRLEKPAPLESAVSYRQQLSQGYRREVEAVLAQARCSAGDSNDCLTRVELAALLSESLSGRLFTVGEAASLADFFNRYAPLPRVVVRKALMRAVEEKGTQRHIRFYLDAIRAARMGKEEA